MRLSPIAGSSPRVRGTRRRRPEGPLRGRFIPACAGNANGSRTRRESPSVHPRVCGERIDTRSEELEGDGSSPRVRGTRSPAPQRSRSRTVHPRVCGERAVFGKESRNGDGSSPRVRGTHTKLIRLPRYRRFIPACAGNASATATIPGRRTVHPRVCGEREVHDPVARPHGGSSPRVRGTRVVDALDASLDRFIPACAGNART